MLFPSEEFLFLFLPIVLGIYYVFLRKTKNIKNIFLLLASLFFYASGERYYLKLILFVIVINWLFGILVDFAKAKNWSVVRKLFLFADIAINLAVLGRFKYTGFVVDNLNRFLHTDLINPGIVLPIGISFFTFQAMSYTIDVYRGHGHVQKNPLNVGLYISFFPQLIAGPIVRYETVAEQIEHRQENLSDFTKGISRFIVGLGKKVLIANSMGLVADTIFGTVIGQTMYSSVLAAWLGAISYTLQIFFDFAGYSDMAIGLGQMFGFHFEENFNYPYISKSISEFWRRWHMSLQTWFRDYVYFPLGGSRVKSKARLVFNLFVVWALTGIWHGANWTFIAWGLMYFVLLTFEKLSGLGKTMDRSKGLVAIMGHIYTMLFVILGWVLFRADNIGQAVCYVKTMFGLRASGFVDAGVGALIVQNWMYYVAAAVACLPIVRQMDEKNNQKLWWNILYVVFLIMVLLLSILYILNNSYNPFIYFNF